MKSQKTYLYVFIRTDISPVHCCIQGTHAAIEYIRQYGSADSHPSVIYLQVKDKETLMREGADLESKGIVTAHFSEPYMDWGVTSISCMLTEDQRHLLTHLQLWTSSPKTI